MSSVNKAIVLGNLGKDPETRYTAGGDAVTNISLATSEQWKDKSGEKQEKTEWHRIVLFGRQAEIAGEYLHKGDTIYIEGKLQTRKYTDKDGVEKYSTEIVGDRMQFIKTKREDDGGGQRQQRPAAGAGKTGGGQPNRRNDNADFDDDIHFVINDLHVDETPKFERRIRRHAR